MCLFASLFVNAKFPILFFFFEKKPFLGKHFTATHGCSGNNSRFDSEKKKKKKNWGKPLVA